MRILLPALVASILAGCTDAPEVKRRLGAEGIHEVTLLERVYVGDDTVAWRFEGFRGTTAYCRGTVRLEREPARDAIECRDTWVEVVVRGTDDRRVPHARAFSSDSELDRVREGEWTSMRRWENCRPVGAEVEVAAGAPGRKAQRRTVDLQPGANRVTLRLAPLPDPSFPCLPEGTVPDGAWKVAQLSEAARTLTGEAFTERVLCVRGATAVWLVRRWAEGRDPTAASGDAQEALNDWYDWSIATGVQAKTARTWYESAHPDLLIGSGPEVPAPIFLGPADPP